MLIFLLHRSASRREAKTLGTFKKNSGDNLWRLARRIAAAGSSSADPIVPESPRSADESLDDDLRNFIVPDDDDDDDE